MDRTGKVTRLAIIAAVLALVPGLIFAGGKQEEVTPEEAATLQSQSRNVILERTVRKPGPPQFEIGTAGGTYVTSINNDPRSFNELTARDEDTGAVVGVLYDYLADYDPYIREFTPNLAEFTITADEAADTLDVRYTLRDDLFWTTPDGRTRVKVTSDDVIFWYDEVEGDPAVQHPGYPGQFIEMPDGSRRRIEVEKIDDRSFVFHYPRIVSNPILSTNMYFGPRFIYQPAKEANGVEGLFNVLSIDTNVRTIPSVSSYHITEYSPGVRVVFTRNPNYWKRDEAGNRLPYIETIVMRIVPDLNTEYLLFKEGTKDAYGARPEDLDELISAPNPNYTVYNAGEALGSSFITFNQNPNTVRQPKRSWFTNTKFRQAMSSLLNRERIAQQVYRGLAVPAVHFFAKANPLFDENIKLEYTYNPQRALRLLSEIGFTRRQDGLMYDAAGNQVQFDMILGAENNIGIDMANIFADELKNVGITMNVRPIDFQAVVEALTTTYDWDSVMVALGPNYWPEGGSNVWQSNGNFHIWYPLQERPATEWEARIDQLYNEGRFTIDEAEQKRIYDEYQRIILEQVPLTYIVHPFSFTAIRNKWANVFVDNLDQPDTTYFYLKR
jgi:peptide/nickel transport system substrate-binding protein